LQPTPIILIASADAATRNLLASYLESEGYVLLTAYDAVVALEAVQHNRVAMVLIAVSHPVTAEIELCRELISNDSATTLPILILLAERSDQAQFEALGLDPEQIGALPITRMHVQLHVRRILRDTHWGQRVRNHVLQKHQDGDRILVAGDLIIDRDRREVTRGGKLIMVVQPRMFDLLVYLVSNEGVTLTKQQILTQVWGYVPATTTTVAVHVRWLRELLENDPSDPHLICTVQRVGYRFVAASAKRAMKAVTP
jgi:DNA-binding response OmpR family regulator